MNPIYSGPQGGLNQGQLQALATILADELRRPGTLNAFGGAMPPLILRSSGDFGCCRGVSSKGPNELAAALGRLPQAQLQALWNALVVVNQFKTALRTW